MAEAPPEPEPSLRLSRTLSAVGPITDVERAVLRVEHRAAQSRIAEDGMLRELTARMESMGRTMGELHALIAATPSAPFLTAPSPACPPPAAMPTRTASDAWSLLDAGLVAGVPLLLGLMMWRSRTAAGSPIGMSSQPPAADRTKPPPATGRQSPPRRNIMPPSTKEPSPTEPYEVDDTVDNADLSPELADVMLSMGLGGGPIHTLERHIRQHPRHALFHWLKLLELYRRFGQRGEFEKAANELQRHFNVAPPPWLQVVASCNAPSLEDFPDISRRVQELWPRRSCAQYLNRMLEDNRDGSRIGFPPPVVDEILLLLELLRI